MNILKGNKNKQIYTDTVLEYIVLPSNHDGYYATINEYIYGKIPYEQKGYSRYELTRINTLYKYMRIEFSSNSYKINFALNYHKSDDSDIDYYKNNTDFIKNEFYNGKTEIIIELIDDDIKSLYLSVFNIQKSHENKEKKLSNFVFKYEIKETYDFNKVKPEQSEVSDIKYERSTLIFTLPKIFGLSLQSRVNYIAKLIPINNIVENENLYSIALMESQPIKMYSKSANNLNEIQKMELVDLHNDKIYYVIINCEIIEINSEEKFGFQFIYNPTNYNEEKENYRRNISLGIIIIVIAIVILAIAFGIAFFILRKINIQKSNELETLSNKYDDDDTNLLGDL